MTKVVVVGAGGVGASVAFNLLLRTAREVVLIDRRPEMVSSHVMDLEQTLVLGAGHGVRAGEPSDAADADVLVITAAAPLSLNTSRHAYLGTMRRSWAGARRAARGLGRRDGPGHQPCRPALHVGAAARRH